MSRLINNGKNFSKDLIDEEETKVSALQSPNLINKHQSYSRKKFQEAPPNLKSRDIKRETLNSGSPWQNPANDNDGI